jgi:16S rRNA (cytidine1402-2'-O)-methyltransferase
MKGKLYLIPSFLGSENPKDVFPDLNREIVSTLKYFIVEEERTARRFLKKIVHEIVIDDLHFSILNEHTKSIDIIEFLNPCSDYSVGLISEAGVPCVADPGALVVKMAHEKNIEVVPLVGPSSILMSLMASGMNGQSFAFNGYLPIQSNERAQKLRFFEKRSELENQTQIFIETPYRNLQLFDDVIKYCNPDTLLCIASDITLESQFIKTLSIKDWQGNQPNIHKRPTIFCLMKQSRNI